MTRRFISKVLIYRTKMKMLILVFSSSFTVIPMKSCKEQYVWRLFKIFFALPTLSKNVRCKNVTLLLLFLLYTTRYIELYIHDRSEFEQLILNRKRARPVMRITSATSARIVNFAISLSANSPTLAARARAR